MRNASDGNLTQRLGACWSNHQKNDRQVFEVVIYRRYEDASDLPASAGVPVTAVSARLVAWRSSTAIPHGHGLGVGFFCDYLLLRAARIPSSWFADDGDASDVRLSW